MAGMCAYAILLLKLSRQQLCPAYRFFSWYLGFHLARGVLLSTLPYNTDAYGWVWLLSAPVLWLLYVLVVLELYSLVLRNYKGIATLSRWTLMGALGISIVLSALSLVADMSHAAQRYPVILYFNAVERGVVSSLAIFLLLITGFLTWYPVPLSRNVIVHSIVYSIYFLSMTMGLLWRNVTGHAVNNTVNLVLLAVSVSCLLVWILFLNRQGEETTVVLRQHWRPEQEEQLVERLSAINAMLLRSARK
jgi:hypothetical protein